MHEAVERVLVGMGLWKQAGTHSQLEAERLQCLLFFGVGVLAPAFTLNQLLRML